MLLLLYCLKNHKPDFSRKQFNACLPHQCKGEELADNGKSLIERIAKNFEPYLNTEFAKSVDFEAESNYCQTLNVNGDGMVDVDDITTLIKMIAGQNDWLQLLSVAMRPPKNSSTAPMLSGIGAVLCQNQGESGSEHAGPSELSDEFL